MLRKLEESEEIFENLRRQTENKELNQKLEVAGETELDLIQKLNRQDHKKIECLCEEREATIKKLTDDYRQARAMLEKYKSKMEETERRMQEKMSNMEVKLCLSNQKLRVTEQELTEKGEELKRIEGKHLEEEALLEEKIAMTHETYQGMIKEMTERVNSTILNRFESMTEKLEEQHRRYKDTMVEAAKMILTTKKCVEEMKEEKGEMEKLLEGKVREEEREKEKLKEKLLGLGEEKREAIRQLCLWIEDQRDRCEYLEEVLSKMAVARRGQRLSLGA